MNGARGTKSYFLTGANLPRTEQLCQSSTSYIFHNNPMDIADKRLIEPPLLVSAPGGHGSNRRNEDADSGTQEYATKLFDIEHSDFLSTDEAAAYLRTTAGSIRNATSNGKIPRHCYCKFGRRTLYLKSELKKFLLGSNQKGYFDGY